MPLNSVAILPPWHTPDPWLDITLDDLQAMIAVLASFLKVSKIWRGFCNSDRKKLAIQQTYLTVRFGVRSCCIDRVLGLHWHLNQSYLCEVCQTKQYLSRKQEEEQSRRSKSIDSDENRR